MYNIPPRDLEDVDECLEFMDEGKPVVIGESITRISEGEPFTHPRVKEIINRVRERLPGAVIQITTNGSYLDEDMVSFLSRTGNIVIYLSLNSANPETRFYITGDRHSRRAVNSARLLGKAGIKFHGSLVALPQVTGREDLDETVRYLAREGAETVRVFSPGYTRLGTEELRFSPDLPQQLREKAAELTAHTGIPVTSEPPFLQDLRPEVAGILKNSPAARAGVRAGDVIKEIGGYIPVSRVDAFMRLRARESPRLILQRGADLFRTGLDKGRGEAPGVVMEYDLAPELAGVRQAAGRYGAEKVMVLTSVLARQTVRLGLEIYGAGLDWRIVTASNNFFGGSINAAGLLVVQDMIDALEKSLQENPGWKPDLVLLPPGPFDYRGRDLTGRFYREAGEATGLKVEILE